MKFSVLLPTRNRLNLLAYAVETVRRQDYQDWEIVISDNFSDEDIAGFVKSLDDPRILYHRTDSFIPVTDNWNNALEKCSGDYVIMLGDDDCIMKGCLSSLRGLIEAYGRPDFIYTSALLYAYPGVIPGVKDGFLQPYGYAPFLQGAEEPFWLDRKTAVDLVRESMRFRVVFGYNMQFSVISRGTIDSLKKKGPFFQSPYPDYYATNAMLLDAERILVFPKPLVTIGISPKSFGFYYFNESEEDGVQFLKNIPDRDILSRVEEIVLPGTNMNTSWLLAMETVKAHYGAAAGVEVDYGRYRFLQALHVVAKCVAKERPDGAAFSGLWSRLTMGEKVRYGLWLRLLLGALAFIPREKRKKVMNRILAATGTYPAYDPGKIPGNFHNIVEVFEQVDPFAPPGTQG